MRLKLLIPLLMVFSVLFAQDDRLTLSAIVRDIDSWQNKSLEMNLKLKKIDYLFEKIVFYDSDNINIEFSIAGKKKKKELAGDLLNAHDGVMYSVRFTIVGSGNLGGLTGELQGFTPVYSDYVPER